MWTIITARLRTLVGCRFMAMVKFLRLFHCYCRFRYATVFDTLLLLNVIISGIIYIYEFIVIYHITYISWHERATFRKNHYHCGILVSQ